MTSIIKAGLAAIVVIAGAHVAADTAHAKKAKPEAARAAATTDIRDCAKLSADKRDSCISRSRPITGAQIYAKHPTIKERAAASVAKIGAAATAAVASAKLALAKDGTTDIRSCAKVAADKRDQCISRSRPVSGASLAILSKVAKVEAAAAKAKETTKDAAKTAAAKAKELATDAAGKAKAAAAASVKSLKGLVGKDGTTDIRDCAKVDVSLRDKCISASRPVKGAGLLSGITKAATNDPALENAAKAAAVRAVTAVRNVFAKDGTTDIRDCGKVEAGLRDKCISSSRPVSGAQLMQRS